MGLSKRLVYRPVEELDVSSTSDEVYISANVKGINFLLFQFSILL